MRRLSIGLFGVMLLIGCNTSKVQKGTLSGTVTYKGQAVNGGALRLFNSSGSDAATIPLNQDGTFRSSDVPAGEYKVVIEPSAGSSGPPAQNLSPEMKERLQKANMSQPATIPIPEKCKKLETTNLSISVNKSGETKVTLELTD
jgi:hypothetical protein